MPAAAIEAPARPRISFWKKHRALIVSLVLPAAALGLSMLIFGVRYDTNDDATIANIAAGAYGADTLHLIYVNFLFAALLRPFYAIYAAANWYVIVQVGINFICAAILCKLCIEKFGTVCGVLMDVAMLVGFGSSLLYRFQYVKNSMLWLVTGLCLLALSLGQKGVRPVVGIVLAVLGSLLRWQNFYAAGAMAACLVLARFFGLNKAEKRRAVIAVICLIGTAFAAHGLDTLFYRMDPEWNAFERYNAARTQFSDYKTLQLKEGENVLADCGVSDTDYAILLSWDFYDGTVFPAERLVALADAVPGPSVLSAVEETLKSFLDMIHGACWRYAFALVVLGGVLLLRPGRRCLAFYGTGAMLAGLVFYLNLGGRFPARVEVALELAFCVFGLAAICEGELRKQAGVPAAACLLAAVLVFSAPKLMEQRAAGLAYREAAVAEENYFEAIQQDKEHLYLFSTVSSFIVSGMDVWHPRPAGWFSNVVVYGGWMSHTPSREATLAAYGLTNPLCDAINADNVYLAYHAADLAAAYAAEHSPYSTVSATERGAVPLCPYQLVSG